MCHLSLRVWINTLFVCLFMVYIYLFLSFKIFFCIFVAMFLIGHDLHHNYGLCVIGVFNLFEYCISLEISVLDSRVGLEETSLV
jgi:hypothetical protein